VTSPPGVYWRLIAVITTLLHSDMGPTEMGSNSLLINQHLVIANELSLLIAGCLHRPEALEAGDTHAVHYLNRFGPYQQLFFDLGSTATIVRFTLFDERPGSFFHVFGGRQSGPKVRLQLQSFI
jgi:hypothetical protein